MGPTGGGNVSQIIPLDPYTSSGSNTQQLPVKIVSPAEQVVDQAKSELNPENIKPSAVKEIFNKPKSRRGKQPSSKKTSKKLNVKKGGKSQGKVARTEEHQDTDD